MSIGRPSRHSTNSCFCSRRRIRLNLLSQTYSCFCSDWVLVLSILFHQSEDHRDTPPKRGRFVEVLFDSLGSSYGGQKFNNWREKLEQCGFKGISLAGNAVAQVTLLLGMFPVAGSSRRGSTLKPWRPWKMDPGVFYGREREREREKVCVCSESFFLYKLNTNK